MQILKYCIVFLMIFNAVFLFAAEIVNLAIIGSSVDEKKVMDLLYSEFSKYESIHLLDRSELEAISKEYAILNSSISADYKTGAIASADAVLFLKEIKSGKQRLLTLRLVSVRYGLIMGEFSYPLPIQDLDNFLKNINAHFIGLFDKLSIPPADIVKISLLNARSENDAPEFRRIEKELTKLLAFQLMKVKNIFVLERWNLGTLKWEKAISDKMSETAFATGSIILDGNIYPSKQADGKNIEVVLRLKYPGGNEVTVKNIGEKDNLLELSRLLCCKITDVLGTKPPDIDTSMNIKDEAASYFKEAKWAYDAGLYEEAASAAETAYALGAEGKNLPEILVSSYSCVAYPGPPAFFNKADYVPQKINVQNNDKHLELAIASLEFYRDIIASKKRFDWKNTGIKLVIKSSFILRSYYEQGYFFNDRRLNTLRDLIRSSVDEIMKSMNKSYENFSIFEILAFYSPFWYESSEETLNAYKKLLSSNISPPDLMARNIHYFDLIRQDMLPENRKGIPLLLCPPGVLQKSIDEKWNTFVNELYNSGNLSEKCDGIFFKFNEAVPQSQKDALINEIKAILSENSGIIFDDKFLIPADLTFLNLLPYDKYRNDFLYSLIEMGFDKSINSKRPVPTEKEFIVFNKWISSENDKERISIIFGKYKNIKDASNKIKIDKHEEWILNRMAKSFARFDFLVSAPQKNALIVSHFWSPYLFSTEKLADFKICELFTVNDSIVVLGRYKEGNENNYIIYFLNLNSGKTDSFKIPPGDFKGYSRDYAGCKMTHASDEWLVIIDNERNVFKFDRRNVKWSKIKLPSLNYDRLYIFNKTLFLSFAPTAYPSKEKKNIESTQKGILSIDLQNDEFNFIANSKRNPALTKLDGIDDKIQYMFVLSDDKLLFTFDRKIIIYSIADDKLESFYIPSAFMRAELINGKIFLFGYGMENYCFIFDPAAKTKIPILEKYDKELKTKIMSSLKLHLDAGAYYNGKIIFFLIEKNPENNMCYTFKILNPEKINYTTVPFVLKLKDEEQKNLQNNINEYKMKDLYAFPQFFAQQSSSGQWTSDYLILPIYNSPGFWYIPVKDFDEYLKDN